MNLRVGGDAWREGQGEAGKDYAAEVSLLYVCKSELQTHPNSHALCETLQESSITPPLFNHDIHLLSFRNYLALRITFSPELFKLKCLLGLQCLSFLQSCRYARLSNMSRSKNHKEGIRINYSYFPVIDWNLLDLEMHQNYITVIVSNCFGNDFENAG